MVEAPDPDPKPREPTENECCGNGCAQCVWTVYWEELQKWEARQPRQREAGDDIASALLAPGEQHPLT